MSNRLTENLKNQAIACCGRVSDRITENLKNQAIVSCGRVSDRLTENRGVSINGTENRDKKKIL
ncbi:hypothetical protein [Nostoc sp. 'Peltigera membranacea cyanobiont' 232]|uniref:hypothetical protein n=1 Tax=Nostoc sp. 'Peltigera membranacea cyanobiont' 232 TaxID=2014531 RepID=UPI000B950772|nr:hypothetical protein [Nostoc sp. 'Peltigera membranacea cyanobiont' 232]OYE01331.1 hypothetical protein CDG79_30160 [Nostoc sp. 'Peltigera membranacea cyanobiont' 232]